MKKKIKREKILFWIVIVILAGISQFVHWSSSKVLNVLMAMLLGFFIGVIVYGLGEALKPKTIRKEELQTQTRLRFKFCVVAGVSITVLNAMLGGLCGFYGLTVDKGSTIFGVLQFILLLLLGLTLGAIAVKENMPLIKTLLVSMAISGCLALVIGFFMGLISIALLGIPVAFIFILLGGFISWLFRSKLLVIQSTEETKS